MLLIILKFTIESKMFFRKIFLKKKLTFVVKNSYTTWWKNFLCLEGAFKILVYTLLFFVKKKLTEQFLKKIFTKIKKIKVFFMKIFFFKFFLKFFLTLKWLLKTVFINKLYN